MTGSTLMLMRGLAAVWLILAGLRIAGVLDDGADWIDMVTLSLGFLFAWIFVAWGLLRERP